MHQSLKTERLILKNIDFEDTEFIYQQFTNDFINKYLFDAEPFTSIDEAKDLINFYTYNPSDMNHRYILLNDSLEKMGTLGFHNYQKENHTIDIGYDLREEYNNKGYMREALNELINYLENDLKIHAIHACIYKENSRSISLVESLGFTLDGTKNEWFRNEAYEHFIYKRINKNT